MMSQYLLVFHRIIDEKLDASIIGFSKQANGVARTGEEKSTYCSFTRGPCGQASTKATLANREVIKKQLQAKALLTTLQSEIADL